jgi:hypothetical protein
MESINILDVSLELVAHELFHYEKFKSSRNEVCDDRMIDNNFERPYKAALFRNCHETSC